MKLEQEKLGRHWFHWVAVAFLGAGLFLLTQGPTAWAIAARGGEPPPVGIYNFDDQATYFSYIEQARQSPSLLVENRYTPIASQPYPMPVWSLLGVVSLVTGVNPAIVYVLAIGAAGTLLLLLVNAVARSFVGSGRALVATLLVAGAGGLGWIGAYVRAAGVVDPWVKDLFPDWFHPQLTLTGEMSLSPHLLVAHCSVAALVWLVIRKPNWRNTLGAAAATALACTIHPFSVPVVVAIAGFSSAARMYWGERAERWAEAARGVAVALAASGIGLYYARLVASDGVAASWYGQNQLATPSLLGMLLLYLPLLPLVATGVRYLLTTWRTNSAGRLLLLWLLVPLAVAYLPLAFQRRVFDGYFVPVGLVAAIGWVGWRGKWRVAAAVGLCFILAVTPLVRSVAHLGKSASGTYPSDLTDDEVSAIRWVGARCAGGAVVADSVFVRSWIPALAPGCHTDAISPSLTPNFHWRYEALNRVLNPETGPTLARALWDESFAATTRYVILASQASVAPPRSVEVARFGSIRVLEARSVER